MPVLHDAWLIWIPGYFPSRNEAERAARGHKMAGARVKKLYTEKVEACGLEWRPSGWKPIKRYGIRLVWHCVNGNRDPDNIAAAIKYVLDGLVRAGILADDRWSNVTAIEHRFLIAPKEGVQVFITTQPQGGTE